MVVTEGSAGTLNFKNQGIKTNEKTISLGEEHSETLPNGEMARVSAKKNICDFFYKNHFSILGHNRQRR